jgi:hypothetical protein
LTDPRTALADQASFIEYLLGLASITRAVHELAADEKRRVEPPSVADDFTHLLLGIASLGAGIERLRESTSQQQNSAEHVFGPDAFRWLR